MIVLVIIYFHWDLSTLNTICIAGFQIARQMVRIFCAVMITREDRLYQGKVAIVACLSKLPKTQHDPHSLAVNITLLMVNLEYNLLD
jgi:hypothetical protein